MVQEASESRLVVLEASGDSVRDDPLAFSLKTSALVLADTNLTSFLTA